MNEPPKPRHQGLYDWMQSIVVSFIVVLFLLTFVVRTMGVEQVSMTPTLLHGNRMIVRTLAYTPSAGDVVIFVKADFEDGAPLVKRIIGMPGDVVDLSAETGLVYINGVALDEPYTNGLNWELGNIDFPYTVPDGHVFVIGDNRNFSHDSRHVDIGPVDKREIIGQVIAVVWPLSSIRWGV